MARDSGRYDAFTDTWIDDNVRIDFAWGNIPIQPNDDRDEDAQLVYELDSHNIAIDGYGNYPNAPLNGLVSVPQVRMPEDLESYAIYLETFGLVGIEGEEQQNTIGSQLNYQVTTTSPAAGTLVAPGTEVFIDYYGVYVAPPLSTGPIAAISNNDIALAPNDFWMYLVGRTVRPTVGDFINITGTGDNVYNNNNYEVLSVANDDAFNSGGTKVKIHCVTGTVTPSGFGESFNGTWTKVG